MKFVPKSLKVILASSLFATTLILTQGGYAQAATTRADGDGISMASILDYSKNGWLKSDWFGRQILEGYLYGAGMGSYPKSTIILNGTSRTLPVWDLHSLVPQSANTYQGPYMMNNERLRATVQSKLNTEFNSISKGKSKSINISFAATIENGEGIIGYHYLHGTNANAGGFKIKGTANKDNDGNVVANLFFQWNDVIDPNFEYDTDKIKADLAKKVPGANPTDYIIRVGWDFKVVKNLTDPAWYEPWKDKTTWPFVKF